MSTFDLYAKKRNLFAQANDLRSEAAKQEREMTPEELAQFEKYYNDITALERQIEAENRMDGIASHLNDPFYNADGKKVSEKGDSDKQWRDAFSKYLRLGTKSLNENERDLLNLTEGDWGIGVPIDPTGENRKAWRSNVENRAANSVITNPTYFNPTTLADQFSYTLKAIGPWMDAVTVINDASGNDLTLPYYNDAGNDGSLESEGTDAVASSTDLDAAKITLSNYWMSSTGVKVGISTLRDSAYPVNDFIVQPLMDRLARKISYYGTVGTGSSEPKGITACATVGEIVSKNTTPTATDMNNLLKLVDYAYHTGPKSGWMFHSDTMFRLAATVKSTTYNTEPLWQPSLAAGIPSTLYGYKYWINNNMDQIAAATKKPMIFGDFSYFIMRYVGPLIITRMDERYIETGKIGFLISQYMDSNVRAAGTTYNPFKYIRTLGT